jgi:hypothetical protein
MMKMNRLFLSIGLLLISLSLQAQDEWCNCSANLDSAIAQTERNYAGFPVKVTDRTRSQYRSLVHQLRIKASKENRARECFPILSDYVRFFKDKHFITTYYDPAVFDSIVVPINEDEFKAAIAKTNSVEGIWVNPDGNTRIAIQKTASGTFRGIKLAGTADRFPVGFVYFSLTPFRDRFIVRSYNAYSSTAVPAKLYGHLLQLWNHAIWGKEFPQRMTASEVAELQTWQKNNHGLTFKQLEKDVAYLKVPTFFNNDDAIQQLINQHDAAVKSSKYLIVDLRGNGGGNTGWVSFLHYFMTNPIIQYPSQLRVTPDNVKRKLPDLEAYVLNPISEEYKKYFPDSILAAYKRTYQELPTTNKTFYPIPGVNFPLDSITVNPKRIALVVDDLCGSSAEYFFFLSKQSRKTVSYGVNTIGMMDYEGMSIPSPMPYEKFVFTIPIAKSSWTDRQPIDATGFTPNVSLKGIPQSEWIGRIIKDLKKRDAGLSVQ